MRKYELVIVIDGRTSLDDRAKTISEVEVALGQDSIIQKDEIWSIEAAYELWWIRWNDKMYLVSYYCDLAPERIKEIKAAIAYVKWLTRHFFYSMTPSQKFFTYKELNDKFAKMAQDEESAKAAEQEKGRVKTS